MYFTRKESRPTKRRNIGSLSPPNVQDAQLHQHELIPRGLQGKQRRLKCRECARQGKRRPTDTQYTVDVLDVNPFLLCVSRVSKTSMDKVIHQIDF